MNADRHAYNHDEDHHKTTKSILDGGIVLLKSSMDHKSLQHAAKRVASKEARLYGEEFHRKWNRNVFIVCGGESAVFIF